MKAPVVKPPDADDARTPFERFQDLARRLLRVPKAEIDEQAKRYRKARESRHRTPRKT